MMGRTPPTASMCQSGSVEHQLREASVSEVIIIGPDIAKHVFHVHGADERGARDGMHSDSKEDVAAVRTDALTLIETRLVGSKEYVRRHDVVDFSDAALGD